jgi:serine/threonine protein kinase/Tfp pilus assembly protein PilF
MIGKIISHYKITEELGRGGMGIVYKAHDTKLDRDVALKFLPPHLDASAEDISRFEQEAKAISALNHPYIETIYDVDEIDEQKYLVLEYIPGGTLKSKLKQLRSEDKTFSISEVLDYGIQLAEGLGHAHRHQIIHRDVKTDNILLTEEGKVKLTDFGLAKLRGTIHKTKTGSTLGTAAYMSPEQIRGEEVDQRSDLWSLGVVLYELVTSHLPFPGEYEAAVTYAILNEDPQAVRSVRSEVPPELEKMIIRCLEKDRSKRYQQADEMIADLKSIQQNLSDSITISSKPGKWRWILALVIFLLAVVGLYLFYSRSGPSSTNQKTIAVLPFKNLSDSKEDEYFSDGITEDILTQVSKISDLNVISRTTIMQYKNTQKSLKQIGEELKVGVVLEGSVRHAGNRIRVSSQLIDAEADRHLWAETYDREMKDVFAIQSEVAEQIAVALKAKLEPGEKERIEKKQTENTEAYQLYLKGRFYWNKRRLEDVMTSIEYFQHAIEKDPGYALAYAGLASACVLPPSYGTPLKASIEWYAKARDAATKALQLDSTLAEAHVALGEIAQDHYYDWAGAERHFRRAIELNPGYPTAHHWYSCALYFLGRFDEALAEAKRALELDPLSLIINMNLGDVYYAMRQYDRATEQYKNTVKLDQTFPWAHSGLASIYEVQGKFNEAIMEYEKAKSYGGNVPYTLAPLGWIYAKVGKKIDALRVLDELLQLAEQGISISYGIALIYYQLGEKDKAFEWLEKSYQDREVWLMGIGYDPLWDDVRSDPRSDALLQKMGLRK